MPSQKRFVGSALERRNCDPTNDQSFEELKGGPGEIRSYSFMSDVIISTERLGKKYRITHQAEQRSNYKTLREAVTNGAKNLVRTATARVTRQDPAAAPFLPSKEDFWALRDISFEVKQGEAIGIIGRNGAGKSTLLKILSRITEPSEGRLRLKGRVASLLEVGTGFHPELTGRENIFLNGAIMGMSRSEIKRKFDEIVAFAEVEKFLDTPVKRFSSGMYVRLAFAVAAHLESEILIVDEVLAVGDAQFQKKCMDRMKRVSRGGRTVLFVSHNMNAVNRLCTRAIVLKGGSILTAGAVDDCIRTYSETEDLAGMTWEGRSSALLTSPLVFSRIAVVLEGSQPNHSLHIQCGTLSSGSHKPAFIAVDILDDTGTPIMQAVPTLECLITSDNHVCQFEIEVRLPPLIPGRYAITLWIGPHNTETYDLVPSAVGFEIINSPTEGRTFPHSREHGIIVPHSAIRINVLT